MACQLTFLNGPRAGQTLCFEQASFFIGRDPSCELALDPDDTRMVSARHLEIRRRASGYEMVDCSSNGTSINGTPRSVATLRTGDVMQLGREGPKLRVQVAPDTGPDSMTERLSQPQLRQPATEIDSSRATHIGGAQSLRGRPPQAGPSQSIQPRRTPVSEPLHSINSESHNDKGAAPQKNPPNETKHTRLAVALERIPEGTRKWFDQKVVRIGRDPTADLRYDTHRDLLVSYNHAKIMLLDGEAVLFDTESTNGTFVDHQRISRLELKGGELIEWGRGGPQIRVFLRRGMADAPSEFSTTAQASTIYNRSALPLVAVASSETAILGSFALADGVTIGRSSCNTIALDSMFVSCHHAVIRRLDSGYELVDTNSANGVFVDGQRVLRCPLTQGLEFNIGPFALKLNGTELVLADTRTQTWIDALELTRTDRKTGRRFLDSVSLKILPGELVCILGPSGGGKSTLLRSISGLIPADNGRVLINNIDFYDNYEQLKHRVGFVPQDDIIHPQLSVWRTLTYAAQLRLPSDTDAHQREESIRDVLSALELHDHRERPVHQLSGGQRKRVSIAVELLTDPAVLYLDEPTSGLDPHLEEKMMVLLREMTLRGKTVAAVTHTLDNVHLADKVVFLVDGRLAFFGTGDEACQFFDVERLPDAYKRFEEAKGNTDSLRSAFAESVHYERHIGSQLGKLPAPTKRRFRRRQRVGPGPLRQFGILSARYAEIMTRDLRNTAILLAQAPLVALLIALAVQSDQPDSRPTSTTLLIMSLSALWFGCSNAAREITKEAAVFRRERMANLRIGPYVASKVFVLQGLALAQVSTMLLLVSVFRAGHTLESVPQICQQWNIQACASVIVGGVPGSFGLHLINLYLTALNGIGIGLLVSALAGNSDKAMSLVPLVLIPQVLFSGGFGITSEETPYKRAAGYAVALNWSLDQAKRIAMCAPEQERPAGAPGSGCSRCLHAYDPHKHRRLGKDHQDDDAQCAAVLPALAQMTDFPEALEVVEDGLYTPVTRHSVGQARDATKSYIGMFVLAAYTLLLVALVCLVMQRKRDIGAASAD